MSHDDQLSEQDLRDLIQRRADINRLAWQRPPQRHHWLGITLGGMVLFIVLAVLSTANSDLVAAVEIGAGVVFGIAALIGLVVGAWLYLTRRRQ